MARTAPRESATGKQAKSPNAATARVAMAKRAAREKAAGFKHITVALSPKAVELIDGYMAHTEFKSRQAALNAILERIDDDMFMRQEFVAVST
jgi:hypothetical protein